MNNKNTSVALVLLCTLSVASTALSVENNPFLSPEAVAAQNVKSPDANDTGARQSAQQSPGQALQGGVPAMGYSVNGSVKLDNLAIVSISGSYVLVRRPNGVNILVRDGGEIYDSGASYTVRIAGGDLVRVYNQNMEVIFEGASGSVLTSGESSFGGSKSSGKDK